MNTKNVNLDVLNLQELQELVVQLQSENQTLKTENSNKNEKLDQLEIAALHSDIQVEFLNKELKDANMKTMASTVEELDDLRQQVYFLQKQLEKATQHAATTQIATPAISASEATHSGNDIYIIHDFAQSRSNTNSFDTNSSRSINNNTSKLMWGLLVLLFLIIVAAVVLTVYLHNS